MGITTTIHANPVFSDTMPTLRVPWLIGSFNIDGGYSYGCGDHTDTYTDKYAIDFNIPSNTPLVAVFDGTITKGDDGTGNALGQWVSVDHGDGWIATYGHMNDTSTVTNGQSVVQGQKIGLSGSTGNSSGSHLHFRLRKHSIVSTTGNSGGGTPGISVQPEPMSGYTGFAHYGLTYDLYQGVSDRVGPVCGNNPGPLYAAPVDSTPDGQWLSPTPADGTTVGPGATIHVNVRGLAQTGSWIDHIDVKWLDSGSYGNQTWSTRTNTFVTGTMQGDFSTDISAPLTNLTDEILVKFDVYNNLGNSKIAVQGIRRFCLTNSSCIPYATVGGTGGLGGGSNPTPTPTSGSGGTGSTCTDAPTFSDHRDGDVINTGSTTFHWNAPSSCTPDGYSFNVSPTSDPEANKIFGGGVGPTEYAYNFTTPGTYYISVRACKTCTPYVPGPWVTIRVVVQAPPPNDAVILYQEPSYDASQPWKSFTYSNDNQCFAFGDLASHNDSIQFKGIAGDWGVNMYYDTSCGTFVARYDHDTADFGVNRDHYGSFKITYTGQVSNSIQICQDGNYGGTCEFFHWDGNNNTCYKFDDTLNRHQDSVALKGTYKDMYDVIFTGTDGCQTGDREVFHDQTDFSLARNQYSSVRLVKFLPPSAPTLRYPADGATLKGNYAPLSWNGGADTSQVHVWGPNYHYTQPWQAGNSLTLQGLAPGTYSWQVQTQNSLGASPWSPVWTLTLTSCVPGSYQVAVFESTNYNGRCTVIGVGDYPTAGAVDISNDALSSVKLGPGTQATMWWDQTYSGNSHVITSDDPDLSTSGSANVMSSLKVSPVGGDVTALWAQCAGEWSTCIINGTQEVRFGTNGSYLYKLATGSIGCNSSAFGGDPTPGIGKHCDVDTNWKGCTTEWGTCSLSQTAYVRFGTNDKYLYKLVTTGSIGCNSTAFGGDPVPGIGKYCDVENTPYTAQYFDNQTLSGTPKVTRLDQTINFTWTGTSGAGGSPDPSIPGTNFSARWTKVDTFGAGTYQFSATADDGVRLYVDGQLIIDQWHGEPPTTYTATLNLSAGSHTIIMEYFQIDYGACAKLSYTKTA